MSTGTTGRGRRCSRAGPAGSGPTPTTMRRSTFWCGRDFRACPLRPAGQGRLHGEGRSRWGPRRPVNKAGAVHPHLWGPGPNPSPYRVSTPRYESPIEKRMSIVTWSPPRRSDSTRDGGIGLSMRGSPQAESGTAHGSHMATRPVSTSNLDAIALRGHEPALPAVHSGLCKSRLLPF